MGITDLRVLATVLAAIAMVVVAIWAFGPSRRKYFRDAAQMPFDDDDNNDAANKPDESDRQNPAAQQTDAGEEK